MSNQTGVKIVIEGDASSAVKATSEAAAGVEKLTNTGTGLASQLPKTGAATDEFVIKTKAEYEAIVAAEAALQKRIVVTAASGKATAELIEVQKAMQAALSTEQALLVAEKIENEAAAAAALERAAAEKVAAGATALNAGALREFGVLAGELARGNVHRLEGSLFTLANRLDLMKYVFSGLGLGVISAGVAFYALYEHLKSVNEELQKTSDAQDKLNLEQYAASVKAVASSWDEATEANAKYAAAVATAGSSEDPTKKQIENAKTLQETEISASEQIIKALGKVAVERLKASGASDQEIAAAEARTQAQLEALEQKKDGMVAASLQDELTRRTGQQRTLDAAAGAARKTEQAEKDKKDRIAHDLEKAQTAALPGGDLEKQRQAAADKLADAQNQPDVLIAPTGQQIDRSAAKAEAIKQAQQDLISAQAEIERNQKQIGTLKEQLAGTDYELAKAHDKAERANKAGIENARRVADLPGEISQQRQVGAAKSAGDFAGSVAQAIIRESNATNLQEAVQALHAAQALARQLQQLIKGTADTHSALYAALIQEFGQLNQANIVNYNRIQQAQYNSH